MFTLFVRLRNLVVTTFAFVSILGFIPLHSVHAAPQVLGDPPCQGDLAVWEYQLVEPVVIGSETYLFLAVKNEGPGAVDDVVLTVDLAQGMGVQNSIADQGGVATSITPAGKESFSNQIGTLAPGQQVHCQLVCRMTAPAKTSLTSNVSVRGSCVDTDEFDNSIAIERTVPVKPVVNAVQPVDVPDKPFKMKITGKRFRTGLWGLKVFIGDDTTPWPSVRYLDTTKIVLQGGDDLKARFPQGVLTKIKILNFDGGLTETTFTR
jgi:hypothetical protein